MDFYEVVRTRRSVRSFRSDVVPEEVLDRVLEAARIAPSGMNNQPWRFIVVKDEATKRRLAPACRGQTSIAEAPVVIAACGFNINYNRGGYMGDMSMLVDISIAFTHLILAARAEGLGTCWIGAFDNEEVKKVLGIPEDVYVVALTPLGYPKAGEAAFTKPTKPRKPMEEIISTDKF